MNRLERLLELMKEKDIDGLLVSTESNVKYLSGFTGDSSFLVVSSKGCMFFTDGRYIEQAENECHEGIEVIKWLENRRNGVPSYLHAVTTLGIKRLGFESNKMSYATFKTLNEGLVGVEFVEANGLIETLRMVKDKEEIKNLRIASQISDRALELTIPYIKPGITEMELTARLEYNLKTNGAHNLSFDSIILSGAKTSLLHGHPGDKKLENGDYILFDFGALYNGYHADMSRTVVLGNASVKHKELYNIIQTAQMESIKTLKSGITGKIPDDKIREVIPEEYIPYYYTGLGHGVGLDIHEDPFLSQASEMILKSNMVVTIEPGIYIPNWGGLRIEDTVVVTDNSYEILTNFSRDLIIL